MKSWVPVICLLLLAAQSRSAAAPPDARVGQNIEIKVFVLSREKSEDCVAVTMFRSVINPQIDLRGSFDGCAAKAIPFGVYDVRLRTKTFEMPIASSPRGSAQCVIDQVQTVCNIVYIEANEDDLPNPLRFKIQGLPNEKASGIRLDFTSVFTPWRRTVSVDSLMYADVNAIEEEFIVTLIVDDKVWGTAYLNRRLEASRSASSVVVECDQGNHSLRRIRVVN